MKFSVWLYEPSGSELDYYECADLRIQDHGISFINEDGSVVISSLPYLIVKDEL